MNKRFMKMVSIVLAWSMAISLSSIANAAVVKPKKISLNCKTKTVYIGQRVKIYVKSVSPKSASKRVTWNSSKKSVINVSSDGIVKGISEGVATITAKSKYNSKVVAKCKVTVKSYKETTLNSNSRFIITNGSKTGYEKTSTNYYTEFERLRKKETALKDKNLVISSYSDLQALKKYVKTNYHNYKKIIRQLNKYDKSYFKKRTLIYYNGSFEHHVNRYEYTVDSVSTKISKTGKITCVINVKKRDTYPPDAVIDCMIHPHHVGCFVSFEKGDIKQVERYKFKIKEVE